LAGLARHRKIFRKNISPLRKSTYTKSQYETTVQAMPVINRVAGARFLVPTGRYIRKPILASNRTNHAASQLNREK
jgi:hypothetical protein